MINAGSEEVNSYWNVAFITSRNKIARKTYGARHAVVSDKSAQNKVLKMGVLLRPNGSRYKEWTGTCKILKTPVIIVTVYNAALRMELMSRSTVPLIFGRIMYELAFPLKGRKHQNFATLLLLFKAAS